MVGKRESSCCPLRRDKSKSELDTTDSTLFYASFTFMTVGVGVWTLD